MGEGAVVNQLRDIREEGVQQHVQVGERTGGGSPGGGFASGLFAQHGLAYRSTEHSLSQRIHCALGGCHGVLRRLAFCRKTNHLAEGVVHLGNGKQPDDPLHNLAVSIDHVGGR